MAADAADRHFARVDGVRGTRSVIVRTTSNRRRASAKPEPVTTASYRPGCRRTVTLSSNGFPAPSLPRTTGRPEEESITTRLNGPGAPSGTTSTAAPSTIGTITCESDCCAVTLTEDGAKPSAPAINV